MGCEPAIVVVVVVVVAKYVFLGNEIMSPPEVALMFNGLLIGGLVSLGVG